MFLVATEAKDLAIDCFNAFSHQRQRLLFITATEVIPVIQMMEQLIQIISSVRRLRKALSD